MIPIYIILRNFKEKKLKNINLLILRLILFEFSVLSNFINISSELSNGSNSCIIDLNLFNIINLSYDINIGIEYLIVVLKYLIG